MSHFAPEEIKSSHSVAWPSLPANINGVYPLASEAHQSPCFSMYEQNLWCRVVLPDVESHKTQQDYHVPFEVYVSPSVDKQFDTFQIESHLPLLVGSQERTLLILLLRLQSDQQNSRGQNQHRLKPAF